MYTPDSKFRNGPLGAADIAARLDNLLRRAAATRFMSAVNASIFTPDGSYLVCGTASGKFHVWHFALADHADEGDAGGLAPSRVATLQAQLRVLWKSQF